MIIQGLADAVPIVEGFKESKEGDLRKLLTDETISAMRAAAAIPELTTVWSHRTLKLSAKACQISGVVLALLSSVVATMVYSTRTIIEWMPSTAAFSVGKLCSLEPTPHCISQERVLSWPHLAGTLVIGMVAAVALLKAQALSQATPFSTLKDRAWQAVNNHKSRMIAFLDAYMGQHDPQNEFLQNSRATKNRIHIFAQEAFESIAKAQGKQELDHILALLSHSNEKEVQVLCISASR